MDAASIDGKLHPLELLAQAEARAFADPYAPPTLRGGLSISPHVLALEATIWAVARERNKLAQELAAIKVAQKGAA